MHPRKWIEPNGKHSSAMIRFAPLSRMIGNPCRSIPMKTPFHLPLAIACAIAVLVSSAPAGDDIATLKAAAEKGSAQAQSKLGDAYQTGKGVPQDPAEAAKWYLKAAGQGHADAQFRLGNIYAYGAGIPRNAAEALKWNRKAAEQGHAKAQFNMGVELLEGDMENRDPAGSFQWLRKAAEQDLAIAQYYVGFLQLHGAGAPKDVREGLKWLNKAAAQGEPHAQYQLGTLHRDGDGIAKDTVTGVKYLNLAAMNASRVPEGEMAWDDLQELESKIPRETFIRGREEAVLWARDAATRSLPEGQYVLGMMHSVGHGLPKDLVQAHLYLSLGLASDHVPEAHYDRMDIEKKMTPAEIEEARLLAREWKPADPGTVRPAWSLPAGMKTLPVNGYPMAYLKRGAVMGLSTTAGIGNRSSARFHRTGGSSR
jgi:TPR repeat protein